MSCNIINKFLKCKFSLQTWACNDCGLLANKTGLPPICAKFMPLNLMFAEAVVGEAVTNFGVAPGCVAVTVVPLVLPVTATVVACNKQNLLYPNYFI